ncbi:unnamed protein product [Dovyalis caffra]|uniref:Uncharacterized protein n=1 Tax=Dovyalis caffra TaxID=77055 RepID=A0AAV1RAM6_9ROSI|nr:unnamed protein product [Dovyalis caffra]
MAARVEKIFLGQGPRGIRDASGALYLPTLVENLMDGYLLSLTAHMDHNSQIALLDLSMALGP